MTFIFGRETAAVFDDMLNRSVPFYGEIQRMTGELIADFAAPDTNIFDLAARPAILSGRSAIPGAGITSVSSHRFFAGDAR